jgi:hypothetical protein
MPTRVRARACAAVAMRSDLDDAASCVTKAPEVLAFRRFGLARCSNRASRPNLGRPLFGESLEDRGGFLLHPLRVQCGFFRPSDQTKSGIWSRNGAKDTKENKKL